MFFTYVKFYFLPKLEGVLVKRNEDMALMQKEIERNNLQAQENLKQAEESIKQAQKLADGIIAEAEAQARIHEGQIIAEAKQIQQDAIEAIIAKQRNLLVGETFDGAVKDSVKIVLQNIGMNVDEKQLEEAIAKMRSK